MHTIRVLLCFVLFWCNRLLHTFYNAPIRYLTLHHFVTQMCACVHISVTKWSIVGYFSNAFWDLWDGSILCDHTSLSIFMMTSSNGTIFRVTGPLCGEFTGPGEFPTQRPVTRSFDVFLDLRLNNRLSKQWWGWWFETPSRSLWRQCNDFTSDRTTILTPLCQWSNPEEYR